MPLLDDAVILKQIDDVLGAYTRLRSRSKHDDCSDLPDTDRREAAARLHAAIVRLAPPGSTYIADCKKVIEGCGGASHILVEELPGILKAVRADYADHYLQSVQEIIHAEVFGDFLEMADHLLEQGFKDPAAVIGGGTLEEHLRKLCNKYGVLTTERGNPKKAEAMNAELAQAQAYSKLDQKSVTAWLDLRNKAAHGKYPEYTKEQVKLMVQGIRDFVTRLPA